MLPDLDLPLDVAVLVDLGGLDAGLVEPHLGDVHGDVVACGKKLKKKLSYFKSPQVPAELVTLLYAVQGDPDAAPNGVVVGDDEGDQADPVVQGDQVGGEPDVGHLNRQVI